MRALGCKAVVACSDGDKVPIPGGYLRLFVQDAGLNREAAHHFGSMLMEGLNSIVAGGE